MAMFLNYLLLCIIQNMDSSPHPGALQSKEIECLAQIQETWHSGLVYETYKMRGLARLWSPKFFPPLRRYSKCSWHVGFQLHLSSFSSSNSLGFLLCRTVVHAVPFAWIHSTPTHASVPGSSIISSGRSPLTFCRSIWVMFLIEFYPEFNSFSWRISYYLVSRSYFFLLCIQGANQSLTLGKHQTLLKWTRVPTRTKEWSVSCQVPGILLGSSCSQVSPQPHDNTVIPILEITKL